MDFDAIRRNLDQRAERQKRELDERWRIVGPKLNELVSYLNRNFVDGFSLKENSSLFVVTWPDNSNSCYFGFAPSASINVETCFISDGQEDPSSYEDMAKSIITRLHAYNALRKLG